MYRKVNIVLQFGHTYCYCTTITVLWRSEIRMLSSNRRCSQRLRHLLEMSDTTEHVHGLYRSSA